MKKPRLAACLVALAAVVIGLVATSLALAVLVGVNYNYHGHVRGDTQSVIAFKLERANGHRVVRRFTATNLPIACADSPLKRSISGFVFHAMRVHHGEFGGRGEWTVLLLDPTGAVHGKLVKPGVARGTLRIRGELAGAGTHCRTGRLRWRATRGDTLPV